MSEEFDPDYLLDEAAEEFMSGEQSFLESDPAEMALITRFAEYLVPMCQPYVVTVLDSHQGQASAELIEEEGDEGDLGWGCFKSNRPDLAIHSPDYSQRLLLIELKAYRPSGMISPRWDCEKLIQYTKPIDYPGPKLGYDRGVLFFIPTVNNLDRWGMEWYERGEFLFRQARAPGEYRPNEH